MKKSPSYTWGVLAALLTAVLSWVSIPNTWVEADLSETVGTRYVIDSETLSDNQIASLAGELDATWGNLVYSEVYYLQLETSNQAETQALIEQKLNTTARIDQKVKIASNDPLSRQQWGEKALEADVSWEQTEGTGRIAVLDSGVNSKEDLRGRLNQGLSLLKGSTARDDNGHGTAVALIIAGKRNNLIGGGGLCGACEILPVKVVDSFGVGYMSDVAEGLHWSLEQNVSIINISLSADATTKEFEDAVSRAEEQRVSVVMSHNDWIKNPYVITVGSTNKNHELSDGNGAGVLAPRCWVVDTSDEGTWLCGTSASAAIVSGSLALSKDLYDEDARAALLSTSLERKGSVFGLINLKQLTLWEKPVVMPTSHNSAMTETEEVIISNEGSFTIITSKTDGSNKATVEYNGVVLQEDQVKPYSLTFNTDEIEPGAQTVIFKTWKNDILLDFIEVPVFIDRQNPEITIIPPDGELTIGEQINFELSDNTAIEKVILYVDEVWRGSSQTEPFSMPWSLVRTGQEEVKLSAKAFDLAGNETTSISITAKIDEGPPSITLSQKTIPGGIVTTNLNTNDDTHVEKIELYVNNQLVGSDETAPWAITWDATLLPSGSYEMLAILTDSKGRTSPSPVTPVVIDKQNPKLFITYPKPGTTVSGYVTIDYSVDDDNGITNVELLIDGAPVLTGIPVLGFDSRVLADGAHTLTIAVTDEGGTRVAGDISIVVNNIPDTTLTPLTAPTLTVPTTTPVPTITPAATTSTTLTP